MVICLERGADLHTAHLMPLPLTVSCFSKIQIGFTFLVPAHPRSPGQRAVKRVYACMSDMMLLLSPVSDQGAVGTWSRQQCGPAACRAAVVVRHT